jgi:hypothetical protein
LKRKTPTQVTPGPLFSETPEKYSLTRIKIEFPRIINGIIRGNSTCLAKLGEAGKNSW